MSISDLFSSFIENLTIRNTESISMRYGEITAALNKEFRDTESKTANTLQVGSFGRKTGINGISDLDILYFMPKAKWDVYKESKQLNLLQDVKSTILKRYPNTEVRVDRLVVTITYTDFHIEVQPVFEQDDSSFKYPDTKDGGSWKITKPREEMEAVSKLDANKNSNLKRLCKMARAWKNKHGIEIGGLLIDTLAYNFLNSTYEYDSKSFSSYGELNRDFFQFLSEQPEQDYYRAPGSNQNVRVKKQFQKKAKKAYDLCVKAIEAKDEVGVNDKWKKVFGRPFPSNIESTSDSVQKTASTLWTNTEQFIEDQYPIDIRYDMIIDCNVNQDGFRESTLRQMIEKKYPLLPRKTLEFRITSINVPGSYEIYWKVLNRGEEAQKRNQIRGQIIKDFGSCEKVEQTLFKGDHVVECYAIKNGILVAKDRIHVPISLNG
ncbi:nucleotide-binding domain-containing protein [Leptospira borgpetersenii]|uniref:nucleotide-binding domain-containing protein n=1 Tax=Leptospira borgpetersenii TaxID=174 RepID=UPI000773A949|nr:nucleotidyltransferase [Leptospira borgpetersenii]